MKKLITGLFLLHTASVSAQVSVTYTGNMGVLLQFDRAVVLIDGLHESYKPAYQFPHEEMVNDLLTNGGRYPALDISLITHFHSDHFSAKLHSQLAKTLVVGSTQVTNPLVKYGYEHLISIPDSGYQKIQIDHKGITIQAFRMDHTNPNRHQLVQNIGYLITMQNTRILHVGDTDWFPEMFKTLDLPKEKIDVAIIPVWLLMYPDSKSYLEKYIKAKQLLATHIDPRTPQNEIDALKQQYPEVIFLRNLGEMHQF